MQWFRKIIVLMMVLLLSGGTMGATESRLLKKNGPLLNNGVNGGLVFVNQSKNDRASKSTHI